jgi:hypothetical protein
LRKEAGVIEKSVLDWNPQEEEEVGQTERGEGQQRKK